MPRRQYCSQAARETPGFQYERGRRFEVSRHCPFPTRLNPLDPVLPCDRILYAVWPWRSWLQEAAHLQFASAFATVKKLYVLQASAHASGVYGASTVSQLPPQPPT